MYPGFLARTPWERLEHLPRYLRGCALRLQKYRANAERDQQARRHGGRRCGTSTRRAPRPTGTRAAATRSWRSSAGSIEELRVSLFAQELRTPLPVSAKRLQKFWDEHLRSPARMAP